MVAQFFERLSAVGFLAALIAFAQGFDELAFGLVILACLFSPD